MREEGANSGGDQAASTESSGEPASKAYQAPMPSAANIALIKQAVMKSR